MGKKSELVGEKQIKIIRKYQVTQEFSAKKSKWGDFLGFLFQPTDVVEESVLRYCGFDKGEIRLLDGSFLKLISEDTVLGDVVVVSKTFLKDWLHRDDKFKIKQQVMVGVLKVNNFLENVEKFWELQQFFYDKSGLFWFWNNKECKWEIVDEVDVMCGVEKELGFRGDTISSKIKCAYLEAFKRVGRERIPKDPPKSWVQFKDKIFDIGEKRIFKATPEYFICNPIPWKLSEISETPVMDKLFEEWVGKEYVKTLYEIIAYCTIIDYPIHLMFCFIGCGRNGKTKFQQLLGKFIGKENNCSTELDLLIDNRFESAKLFKKLVCTLGETNFGVMNKTSLLKKLCGQDLIGYEFKNKNPFDDVNYAKILINSNSLPSSEDTSEGFYRRWLIIDFPNSFPEGKDILKTIPEKEYSALAKKVSQILPDLLERGSFTNQGTIAERQERYIMASNPLPFFIKSCCKLNPHGYCLYSELYTNYVKFLIQIKKRKVSRKEFSSALLNEGLSVQKTSKKINGEFVNGNYVLGIEIVTVVTVMLKFPLTFPNAGGSTESEHNCHNEHIEPVPLESEGIIHHNCHICGENLCKGYHKGRPTCQDCLDHIKRLEVEEEVIE